MYLLFRDRCPANLWLNALCLPLLDSSTSSAIEPSELSDPTRPAFVGVLWWSVVTTTSSTLSSAAYHRGIAQHACLRTKVRPRETLLPAKIARSAGSRPPKPSKERGRDAAPAMPPSGTQPVGGAALSSQRLLAHAGLPRSVTHQMCCARAHRFRAFELLLEVSCKNIFFVREAILGEHFCFCNTSLGGC